MTTPEESAPPELQPPFHPISGLSNFRDIGGWPITTTSSTLPNAKVRKGILFRGPDITPTTETGISQLKALNIKTIFDLRSTPQITRAGGVREIEGIRRVWAPVFEEEEYSQEKAGRRYVLYSSDGTDGIVQAFLEILSHGSTPSFRPLLLHLLSSSPQPNPQSSTSPNPPATLIHCTTGNNRTGAFVALLLSLLGVSDSDVASEYALSEIGLRGERDTVVERLLRNRGFREACGEGEVGRMRAGRMVGARGESVLALLERVREVWGSVEGWFEREVGLTGEEIAKVKRVLVDGGDGAVNGAS